MARTVVTALCGLTLLSACSTEPAVAPVPETPSATARSPVVPDGRAVPRGATPSVDHVAGHWYVARDGRWRLPAGHRGVSGSVRYDGGLLVADAAFFEGTVGLARVRGGKWLSRPVCSGGVPATSADGRYVAWATTLCPESGDTTVSAIHRARASGGDEVVVPVGAGLVSIVGFLDRRIVYNLKFVDGAWITDLASAPRRIPGITSAADVSRRGLVIGHLRDGSSGAVARPDGTVLWRSAAWLTSFSPSGARVLARSDDRLTVLRARDGAELASLGVPAGGELGDVVWETERALLTVRHDGDRAAILRLFLDGRVEWATALREVRAEEPYVLLP